ncbi:hypothetical protein [Nocardiopsis sp. CNR-923]|nr:hypothetical protein [Nocardiopsis sp. CNR-923]
MLLVAAGGHVGGQPQSVDDRSLILADLVTDSVNKLVFDDVQV